MALGFHCSLKSSLLETVSAPYQELGLSCLQCYIGSRIAQKRRIFSSEDLSATTQFLQGAQNRFYIHACLAMNLASPLKTGWNSTLLSQELVPALAVGGSVVAHIGSVNCDKKPIGTLQEVVKVVKGLGLKKRERGQPYPLLLENSAGAGETLGNNLEQLSYLMTELKEEGVGLCLDTAHAFASGWLDFKDKESVITALDTIEREMPQKLQLVHLNDNKVAFGKCADRHEALGKGHIWSHSLEGCQTLLQECQKRGIDVILETPDPLTDYELCCQLLA